MTDTLDAVQERMIPLLLRHVRSQTGEDGRLYAVMPPVLLSDDQVARLGDLYPCYVGTDSERKRLGDLYSLHEDARTMREFYPRFADLMERVVSLLEAERAHIDLTRSLREVVADEDTQERMRPDLLNPRPPPHIDLPEIVTPATPGEPAQRRRSKREDKPTAAERLLTIVESPSKGTILVLGMVLGSIVISVAIYAGALPQLADFLSSAWSSGPSALPFQEPVP